MDRSACAANRTDIGFVFQEPTLMPWATVFDNVLMPLKLQRRRDAPSADAAAAVTCSAGHGRADRFRKGVSARALRRDEDARVDRPRAGHTAAHAADGRTVRGDSTRSRASG
jgi:ABC-type lipoprotein export system ATPase subunit